MNDKYLKDDLTFIYDIILNSNIKNGIIEYNNIEIPVNILYTLIEMLKTNK
jgi:hypothetical protein